MSVQEIEWSVLYHVIVKVTDYRCCRSYTTCDPCRSCYFRL